ncbi:MAG: discoidin domain-containing protein [Coriobacteriaceae bacterium]|nr:discoidin domain-containing protein [Coriobacteriaceae bacterium]
MTHSSSCIKRSWELKTGAAVLAASIALCSVAPAFGAGEVVTTPNVNHALRAQAAASSVESTLTADKAVDGDFSTRWSSGEAKPEKNESTWLSAHLKKTSKVKQVVVTFESRTVDVKPGNVKAFELQYKQAGSDAWKTAQAVTNIADGGGYKTKVVITLKDAVDATDLRVTNFDIAAGGTQWNGVSVVELQAFSNEQTDALATPDVNHIGGATMSASGQEADTLTPAKANDGRDDTRWSSGTAKPDKSVHLTATLKQATKFAEFDVQFENRSVAVSPSNVKSFDIEYKAPGSSEWVKAKSVGNATQGSGYKTTVKVELEQPIVATAVRLTNFDVATSPSNTQWNGVSVVEFSGFSNSQKGRVSLDSVVAGLPNNQTVNADVSQLPLPKVPEGYSVKLNGADFEQVIGADRSIVHPLTDKAVKVSWTVTETKSGKEKTSADLTYTVKGKKVQAEGKNAKPKVVPEIQEWFSDSTAKLAPASLKKVVYSDSSLKAAAEEFAADFKDFSGIQLKVEQGSAQAHAVNFILGAPQGDALLGDEGYTMSVAADRIDVQSRAITGNVYGAQSILQMYKLDKEGFSQGQMRDYPRYKVRGFMWDVARKPISLEMIKTAARTMRYYKMNDIQAHLSDNLIFLEDYKTEEEAWKAYAGFRLECGVTNKDGQSPTSADYAISKKDFKEFIQSERALGMNVVPEIDMPAHAVAFTRTWPELAVHGEGLSINAKRHAIDHFDLRKPEAMQVITDVFDDYTQGENPTFDQDTVVHVGADEFLISNGSPTYHKFVNELLPHIKKTNTVRMWGGLSWLSQGDPIAKGAIEGTQMNLWSKDWADGVDMYNMGFDLINTIDSYGYMVPNGTHNKGMYGDYLNTDSVFNNFAPETVSTKAGWKNIPSGDDQMLGAAFAIWNDNIDTRASGLTEADEYARFFDAMPFYAEKTWAATGKEKGSAQNVRDLVKKTGDAPRTNPYSEVSKKGDTYAEYDFESGLADKSANGRDLAKGSGADVEKGALDLDAGTSYVESPIKKISTGTDLTFDITLDKPAKPGDILFEADAPYGTLDVRVMDNGKLGFTRELYDYYFDYKLPVGKKVAVTIRTEEEKTTLLVNGNEVGTATGRFFDHGMVKKSGIDNASLTMPLQRIGSKVSSIDAHIDNVVVKPIEKVASDDFNKKAWKGATNSWTPDASGTSTEGELRYAWDNNPRTHWHSNWSTVTEQNKNGQLSVTNPIWAEVNFDKAYRINQFSFTPRVDTASGYVTRASLYVKNSKDGAWKQVAKDQAFAPNGSKKTFFFDEQDVCAVKFEVTDSAAANGKKWVAVSEFDIANAPAPTSTVFAQGMAYPEKDGKLDLSSGKPSGTVKGNVADEDGTDSVFRADVASGEQVTLSAVPAKDTKFIGWFAAGSDEPVSTEASYTVDAVYSEALEARFKVFPKTPEPPVDPNKPEPPVGPQGPEDSQGGTQPESQKPEGGRPQQKPESAKPQQKPAKPSEGDLAQTGDASTVVTAGAAFVAVASIAGGAVLRRKSSF